MTGKIVAFIRWLSAPEELPSEATGGDPKSAVIDRPSFLGWLLRDDALQQVDVTPERATRPRGILRYILATETLCSPEPDLTVKPSHPPRFWRWVLGDEELPTAEAADHDDDSRTMFLTRLLESEECPRHAGGVVERREGGFRRLLASEQCPSHPAPVPAKKGFARWLLQQEECPVESPSAPLQRQGFWRDLFASEEL